MAEMPVRATRLAVLIDGDNVSPKTAERLFKEIAAMGEPIVRRVYGVDLEKWKAEIRKHAISARLVVPNVGKKNAADFDLVIEAMELLHEGKVDGFCLASSDSDFTRLAVHLREKGLDVFGFGSTRAPASLRKAVTRFVDLDGKAVTVSTAKAVTKAPKAVATTAATPAPQPQPQPAPSVPSQVAIVEAIQTTKGKDGWSPLNELGKELKARGVVLRHLGDKLGKMDVLEVDGSGNALRVRVKFPRARRARGA